MFADLRAPRDALETRRPGVGGTESSAERPKHHALERAASFDHSRGDFGRADHGKSAHDRLARHAKLRQPIGCVHAVEKREDRRALLSQARDNRRDLAYRIRLDRDDRHFGTSKRVAIFGRQR